MRQGRFSDSGIPTQQDDRTGYETTPEHPVELPRTCRDSRARVCIDFGEPSGLLIAAHGGNEGRQSGSGSGSPA